MRGCRQEERQRYGAHRRGLPQHGEVCARHEQRRDSCGDPRGCKQAQPPPRRLQAGAECGAAHNRV